MAMLLPTTDTETKQLVCYLDLLIVENKYLIHINTMSASKTVEFYRFLTYVISNKETEGIVTYFD